MSTPANFDRLARVYRWLEYLTLGTLLERTRNHYLSRVSPCRRALVLGDGDGRFLAKLLRQTNTVTAVAVDSSGRMLAELRRRCVARSPDSDMRLRLHQGNVLTFVPTTTPDLVVTHFLLDCLTEVEVERLVAHLTPRMAPGALWLVSEFCIPESGWMRLPARLLVRALYLAFRLLTGLEVTRLPGYQRAFARAGLVPLERHGRMAGLLTSELWRCPGTRLDDFP